MYLPKPSSSNFEDPLHVFNTCGKPCNMNTSSTQTYYIVFRLKLCGHFLWMGLNCLKATEPLQGESLLFTISPQELLVLIQSTSEG